ncbi:hypothetical prophage protein [Salmonella enterica]|nr:hypothetical prophage protein [Salmonella enterica]
MELDGAHYLTAGNAYTKTESDNRYVQNIQRALLYGLEK